MSVRLGDLEDLVRLALENGLVGQRQALLQGLPLGFVYSLPTVSRPIDQLRFDLMELSRTPRLIGLDEAPLNVWLTNAAEILRTQHRLDAAAAFERRAGNRPKPATPPPRDPASTGGLRPDDTLGADDGASTGAAARYDVFLTYPDDERHFVERVHDALQDQGYQVFIDTQSLRPGDVWDKGVQSALESSLAVAVFVPRTPDTGRRAWYQPEEILAAIDMVGEGVTRRIIPILFDGLTRADVSWGLRRLVPLEVPASHRRPDWVAGRIAQAIGPPEAR